MSKVAAILLLVGLACVPISFTVQDYLSASNLLLLLVLCVYIIPVYMLAAAQLLILVIGDEKEHMKFRAYSA